MTLVTSYTNTLTKENYKLCVSMNLPARFSDKSSSSMGRQYKEIHNKKNNVNKKVLFMLHRILLWTCPHKDGHKQAFHTCAVYMCWIFINNCRVYNVTTALTYARRSCKFDK